MKGLNVLAFIKVDWWKQCIFLDIILHIYAIAVIFFLVSYKRVSFLELFRQPASLVKVWSVCWNHGHFMGAGRDSPSQDCRFFSPPLSKMAYAPKPWRKGRAISCIPSVIQVSWVSLLSPYTAHPHQTQQLLHFRNIWRRILSRGSQNPTIVRKSFLSFILELSPFPFYLEFRSLQSIVAYWFLFIIT